MEEVVGMGKLNKTPIIPMDVITPIIHPMRMPIRRTRMPGTDIGRLSQQCVSQMGGVVVANTTISLFLFYI
jgi:hypothetical protein